MALSVTPTLAVLALNRMGFGPRPGDIEAFEALPGKDAAAKLEAYVEQQLAPEEIDDGELVERLAAAGFETLHKDLETLWADHLVNNPYDDSDDRHWWWLNLPVDETIEATFLRAIYSRRQLGEVLADFWHNHFNVYGYYDTVTPVFAAYDRDVIRAHQLGNFREMLEAVAAHPSMLYYLDNYTSTDAGPNENFARELFELHTLGAENYLGVRPPQRVRGFESGDPVGYVDNDVYEAARCFTGWRVDDDIYEYEDDVGVSGQFLYHRAWHDRFNKLVMGRYIPYNQPDLADGRQVLDILAEHPGTARHIARKLCRRFLADDPPESVVTASAKVFYENVSATDQIGQVVRTILLSDEFRQSWGRKLKRPFEFAASMLRGLDADLTRLNGGLTWLYGMMGQPLFGRRAPDGYPDRQEAWANSMSLLYRWNMAVGVVENWMNEEDATVIQVDLPAQTPTERRTAAELADYWIERLLGRALRAADRQVVVDFLAQEYAADEPLSDEHLQYWLPGMVELILMSPEFQIK